VALRGELPVEFSGEEALGRYLDLHEHFNRFINSKFGRQLDYSGYLAALDAFEDITRHQRLSKPYREYLRMLRDYLAGFQERTQPLQDTGAQLAKAAEQFEADWASGTVPGWGNRGLGGPPADAAAGALDPEAFDSVEELEQLGTERLKEALQAVGLKAGGTAKQRAERLMLLRDTPLHKLDRKHFAKGVIPAEAQSEAEKAKQSAAAKEAAGLESQVGRLLEALAGVVEATKAQVEKRAALTFEEHQAELAEAEQAEEEDSDEEDDFIYNPLKLPMGWDGKPIPYWLYKLHGLNQEFKCEICGEASYWGRRAFERHFKEWRHQNGMRALGIPNNKLFYEVTKIADAEELWRNVQSREKGGFVRDMEEEYEDAQGNVYNKRTYEDLKRQGII
jgi:splicing factor 3A subunit 3